MSEPRKESIEPLKRRHGWIWGAAFLILIALGIFFYKRPKTASSGAAEAPKGEGAARGAGGGQKGPGGPILVAVTPARTGDIGVYVNSLGLVTPLNTVAIRSRVEGQLVKVLYTEGQWVKEGDPLVEIDPAPYQAAVDQAEGQLARDNASLENARLDLKRYEDAFARNAVPRQQLDTQTSSVRQFEGAVKLDQGQVENARVQLNYCHIRAPIPGRVGLRLVDVGNIVRSNDLNPLVVITQLKPINVVSSVAEDYLPQIQKQMRAGQPLTVDALDRSQEKQIATGVLQTLDNQIDVGTGTVKLKAVFPNEDESLFPNQFVNARLLLETHHAITLVPNQAVQRGSQGTFVFAVQAVGTNSVVNAHTIEVVTTDNSVSEARGLEANTLVAMDNFNRLSDGAKVVVRPPAKADGSAPRRGEGHRTPLPGGNENETFNRTPPGKTNELTRPIKGGS